ncbi:hypothetical protein Ae201684P_009452 [Aphanomyces euteiches]|nr:hypothetical protein Ae201684P_009452 [Aphanomyces euteiches]
MKSSFDQVAAMLRCYSNEAWSSLLRTTLPDIVDGSHLYTLVKSRPREPFHRYAGVHWALQRNPTYVRPCDWCFLESHQMKRLSDNKRIWIRSFKSISLRACPEMRGVNRATFLCAGFIFEETSGRDGLVVAQFFRGYPRRPVDWIAELTTSSVVLAKTLRQPQIPVLPMLEAKQQTLGDATSSSWPCCQRCSKRFLLAKRRICHYCFLTVCQNCCQDSIVFVRNQRVKLHVCNPCQWIHRFSNFSHCDPRDSFLERDEMPRCRTKSTDSNCSEDTLVACNNSNAPTYQPQASLGRFLSMFQLELQQDGARGKFRSSKLSRKTFLEVDEEDLPQYRPMYLLDEYCHQVRLSKICS